jgi:hypothetical protein
MTANVYAKGRVEWSGIVSCLVGVGITLGEIIGGGLAKVNELVLLPPRKANNVYRTSVIGRSSAVA